MKMLVTLLVVAAFFPGISVGQQCEYKVNRPDPFTNATHVETSWAKLTGWFGDLVGQTIGRNSEISVSAVQEGDRQYLAMQLKLSDTTMFKPTHEDVRNGLAIEEGRRMQIVTSNGKVVSLYADQSVMGNTRVNIDEGIYIVKTTIDARYRLDKTSVAILSSRGATGVRIAANYNDQFDFVNSDGYVDFQFTEKTYGKIQHALGCLPQDQEQS